MSERSLEGSRIRRVRLQRGLKQSALAKACDISPAYLNLIEHNKRPAAGALLARIAETLNVPAAELSAASEASLVRRLNVAGRGAPDKEPSEVFAARFPGWAGLVADQVDRIEKLEQVVASLSDRLTHDPFLSASLHNLLSTATSIRSTSSILTSGETIEPEWQARFSRNIHEDAQRLADAAGDLAGYLEAERGSGLEKATLAIDEVLDWLALHDWRFPDDLEEMELQEGEAQELAATLAARSRHDRSELPDDFLLEHLEETPDPFSIAAISGVAPDLVMRRLATLPDDSFANAVSPGLVSCDASGTLTFRKPTRGFEPPHHGSACAVWPLFEALHRPGVPIKREVRSRGRDDVRFVATAFGTLDFGAGYDRPPIAEATMLLIPVSHREEDCLGIGMSCRVCSEDDCPARREVSILHDNSTASF